MAKTVTESGKQETIVTRKFDAPWKLLFKVPDTGKYFSCYFTQPPQTYSVSTASPPNQYAKRSENKNKKTLWGY
jgi:hypothetical protein